MRVRRLRWLFVMLFVLLGCSRISALKEETSYFSPENIRRFALHLYEEGDYLRAAGELERYLYSFEVQPSEVGPTLYRIGLCYRLSGNINKGIQYFMRVKDSPFAGSYAEHSCYQIALSYHATNRYRRSTEHLESCLPHVQTKDIRLRMYRLIGLNNVKQRNWGEAIRFLDNLDENTRRDPSVATLARFAKEGMEFSRKSEFLAGLFSSIVPGSGKVYAKRPRDGLFSLVWIALTIWQAHNGFQKDGSSSLKGWTFATAAAVLYAGNIYGSVTAARLYNREGEDQIIRETEQTIDVDFR